jgi:hypothetical protein
VDGEVKIIEIVLHISSIFIFPYTNAARHKKLDTGTFCFGKTSTHAMDLLQTEIRSGYDN